MNDCYATDAEFKRALAAVFQEYGSVFQALADYDAGLINDGGEPLDSTVVRRRRSSRLC